MAYYNGGFVVKVVSITKMSFRSLSKHRWVKTNGIHQGLCRAVIRRRLHAMRELALEAAFLVFADDEFATELCLISVVEKDATDAQRPSDGTFKHLQKGTGHVK